MTLGAVAAAVGADMADVVGVCATADPVDSIPVDRIAVDKKPVDRITPARRPLMRLHVGCAFIRLVLPSPGVRSRALYTGRRYRREGLEAQAILPVELTKPLAQPIFRPLRFSTLQPEAGWPKKT